jgi:hypothetical protein
MTAPRPAPENPTHGLFYVPGDHEVAVTGEEHHQAALAPYAPRADGRARQVAVELVPAPIARGTHAGKPGIEVRLDGNRIGELTHLMAGRYGPLVADVWQRGGRPSCIGAVKQGERGLQVVLRLPDLRGAAARPVPTAPERPTAVLPAPAHAPAPAAPAARKPRRRAPLLIGAGVVTLLVVIGANLGGGEPAPAADSSPGLAAQPAPTSVAPAATVAPTTTPAPPPPPAPSAQPQPQPRPAAQPRTQPQPSPRPETRREDPPPPPAREPAASSGCNSNYSGCVPIASDVDCAGGEGDGPAYLSGTARVVGRDVYGLDRDKNGIACD